LTVNGNLTTTGSVDINGQELILDADADTSITADSDDQIDFKIGNVDVATLTNSHLVIKGTTPKITIGDGGEEDTALIFDGNAQDFYIGLDDSADDLIIGTGSTVGTNPIFAIKNNGNIGIDEANPTEKLELGDGSTTNRIRIDSATKAHFFGYDGTDDAIQLASQSFIKFQSGASFLERVRIASGGGVAIGTTTPDGVSNLTVKSQNATAGQEFVSLHHQASSGTIFFVSLMTGSGVDQAYITVTGTTGAFTSASDLSLKENIRDLPEGLDLIMNLKPRLFDWKEEGKGTDQVGFIAQEIEEIKPEWVQEKDGTKLLNSHLPNTIPYLIKSIQELEARIKKLEA